MHRKASIALPHLPRRNEFALAVQHVLQATALINADWVLQRWALAEALRRKGDIEGAEAATPKCCAKCNGTKYKPDDADFNLDFGTSPVIFARGYASCGEIAACHTGHKIAEAVEGKFPGIAGKISWNDACARFQVMFSKTESDKGPGFFHAICDDNGKVLDPTLGMKRL